MGPEPVKNGEANGTVILRLYVYGEAPSSACARRNLEAICREHLPGRHRIEIIDVLQERMRSGEDRIRIVPTLVKVSPPANGRIVGDLSDRDTVVRYIRSDRGTP